MVDHVRVYFIYFNWRIETKEFVVFIYNQISCCWGEHDLGYFFYFFYALDISSPPEFFNENEENSEESPRLVRKDDILRFDSK